MAVSNAPDAGSARRWLGTMTPAAVPAVPAPTASVNGSLSAPDRVSLVGLLKPLISKPSAGYDTGLKDTRLGAQILVDWLERDGWIFDRAEEIVISAEDWTTRSFRIDVRTQQRENIPDRKYDHFLPLETIPSNDARDLFAVDENGIHVSVLARVEQQDAVGSMLLAVAIALIGRQHVGSQLEEDVRALATDGTLDRLSAGPSGTDPDRMTLRTDTRFTALANAFLRHDFVCLRTRWDATERHVVRVKYRRPLRSEATPSPAWWHRLAAQLGMTPTVLDITLPDLVGAKRWGFEVSVPAGAELRGARLTVDRSDRGDLQKAATVECDGDSAWQFLKVALSVSKQWRTWVLINAIMITALLAVGAWRIGFVAGAGQDLGTRDLTVALLLGANGAFAAILVRPSEDALASKFLQGVRIAISILGLLAFAAVATLSFGPSGHALFLFWFVLAIASGSVTVLGLAGARLPGRG